jgi:acyl-CoA synthetase (NDP forming)
VQKESNFQFSGTARANNHSRANDDDKLASIRALIYPESIAVVGASSDIRNFPNGIFIPNLMKSGFRGKVFPVNIKRGQVNGITFFGDLKEIKQQVDLVYIAAPAKAIPSILEDAIATGAKSAIAIASKITEDDLSSIRRVFNKEPKFRLCGPNSEGIITSSKNLNLTFVEIDQSRFLDGNISILSQSGGIAASITQNLWQNKAGVAYSLSLGNCIDLDFGDILDFCIHDDRTRVVGLYLEGITKANAFVEATKNLALSKKPLVVLKPRSSKQVRDQIKSHTHALSGEDAIFDAFLKKYGMVRAKNLRDLSNILMAFSWQPAPKGNRAGIVGDSGGYAILLSEAFEQHRITLSELSNNTEKQIAETVGSERTKISYSNPVDTDAAIPEPKIPFLGNIVARDKAVDFVVLIMVGPFSKNVVDSMRVVRTEITDNLGKPIFCVFSGAEILGSLSKEICDKLKDLRIPVYANPEDLASVVEAMVTFGQFQRKIGELTPRKFGASANDRHSKPFSLNE